MKPPHIDRITKILYGPDRDVPNHCTNGSEHEFVTLAHADSVDSYAWISECKLCNGIVKRTEQRSGDSSAFWSF